jgi:outer membrane lipoprotein carrier protein
MKVKIIIIVTLALLRAGFVCAQEKSVFPPNPELNAVLNRLESRMAEIRTVKTGFVQEKELAVFKQKVVLKGSVYIEKPSRLAWLVERPVKYRMIMSGDSITQWDEDTDRVQKISLAKNPAFEAAIGQMKVWFSGNYVPLMKDYEISLAKERPVSLKFIPKPGTFAGSVIKSVTVDFRKDEQYINRIFIEEKGGDTTNLLFMETRLNIPVESFVWKADGK